MAVTKTTAETDGSLTAVTVAETKTDCRPTIQLTVHANFTVSAVSAFRSNVSAKTEFVPLHYGRSQNQAETVC